LDGVFGGLARSRRLNGGDAAVRAIFDPAYYLRAYPDVAEAGADPFAHFMSVGWAEGRNPCALFDTELYLDSNPDVARAGLNPLVHYVSAGAREGRPVSLLFDARWYLAKNPDLQAAGGNPLAHYLTTGATEGREANPLFDQAWYRARHPEAAAAACALAHFAEHGASGAFSPHPLFDAAYYLERYPDVAEAGMNPLAHYLLRGHEETRQPHPLFDAEWYLATYPDVAQAGVNPLLHYLWEGAREGRDPNPLFDTAWYAQTHPEAAGVNPLAHYAERGSLEALRRAPMKPSARPAARPERTPAAEPPHAETTAPRSDAIQALLTEHAHFTGPGPEFEEFDPTLLRRLERRDGDPDPLLVAFYLPQFHPIAENDAFWGVGFTEWRQLSRALPRFPGHYQPRIPRDLGFYDLRNVETIRRQAELAKAAGVGGFAYYYYWFNGKRVLHEPLELLLESNIDMPFTLIWANENWTKTWDGFESDVLLRQDYRPEDEDSLLADIARHFEDRRYIRIDGLPLFVIYNPRSIPEAPQTIARWRAKFEIQHKVRPLIFMAQTFGEFDPQPYGLDGAIEFPPHKLSNYCPGGPKAGAYSPEFEGRVIDYNGFVAASLDEPAPGYPLIKTIVPGWDNDARRPNRGLTLENATPRAYEAWLKGLIRRALDQPVYGAPIVAINAWNEWAEAAYLEPDVHFGAAYLNATARACSAAAAEFEASQRQRVSVVVPNYNHAAFLEERLNSIIAQSVRPGEIIFLDDASSDDSVAVARRILEASGVPYRIVVNEENSGCVFRQWVKGIGLARNELVWIAESDDAADKDFLANLAPLFAREDVMAAFGRISYVDESGAAIGDLDGYYDGLKTFSWERSLTVPACEAFAWDFAVKNVIPNASGLVFRKPQLSPAEIERLCQYRFAGDWYFYALAARGGSIAYSKDARSYFRLRRASTSRAAFFSERHLAEHRMILEDLRREYGVGDAAVAAHAAELAGHFPERSAAEVLAAVAPAASGERPLRICIAAHSFAIGGGELAPVALANALKRLGHHVTYLALEKLPAGETRSVRRRLRGDIPVYYWQDIADPRRFVESHGFDVFNSHNVSWEHRLACDGVDLGVPYVATLHGGYETVADLMQRPEFVGYIARTVDRWLYLSDKNVALLAAKGVPAATFKKSFNALPAFDGAWIDRAAFRAEYGIAEDAFVLALCSRAIEEKGWKIAIDMAAELAREAPRPAHLVLIGDGPYLETARGLAGANVTFLGHVDSPIRYLRCCDLGLLPSTFSGESFPLFLLECFEAGLPVAATTIGEIPAMMGEAAPGALAPHDAGEGEIRARLTAFVRELMNDPARYARLCEAARAASQRFSLDKLAQEYVEAFRGVVAKESPMKNSQNADPTNPFAKWRGDPDGYLNALIASIENPDVADVTFPRFPPADVQQKIHGHSGAHSLQEASAFFRTVHSHVKRFKPGGRLLDFGSGWGRIARTFMAEVDPANIVGLEPNKWLFQTASSLNPYVTFINSPVAPPTDLEPTSFDYVVSWSVFSHLPERLARQWLEEFARLCRPGAKLFLTTWGARFLDWLEADAHKLAKGEEVHAYRANVLTRIGDLGVARAAYKAGDYIWVRGSEDYGEALIPERAMARMLPATLEVATVDHASLPQTLFVLRKP
jgi:glycosyltransferase involved in cell wall biosynthesis/ubiquinone/menaquinone biosynthesis C-methylase UbiE